MSALPRRPILWLVVAIVVGLVLLLTLYFSELLGARVIKPGSSRVAVYRGEKIVLELAAFQSARKLEICADIKTGAGTAGYNQCQTLKPLVAAGVRRVEVTIPTDFPLGRAVVITRLRGNNGALLPRVPTNEKIGLLVRPARPETASSRQQDDSNVQGGGGSGGSGGGSSNQEPASLEPAAVQPVSVDIQRVCVDPIDLTNTRFTVIVRWEGPHTILAYRFSGQGEWRRPEIRDYDVGQYVQGASVHVAFIPDFIQPHTEVELRFEPGYSYPGIAEPSEVFRFNSGPGSSPYCQNV
ncbi:MAG TPA: hypothetical protein VJC05_01860 [Candidatus Andersenbacteria bacterium]|nr:hypothetical protein [Candidatus Andersenbacteria bacterium]